MYKTFELLDITKTIAAPLFEGTEYPWQVLDKISDFIKAVGKTLPESEYENTAENVWIARDAVIFPSAYINGPCIIGHGTEVRHCAFIRGSALIGNGCVIGNSVEIKNAVIFDSVQVPHYNYVGDSVLGFHSHMGAGSITSNVKSDKTNVVVKNGCEHIETGRKKFGAILGDYVEVGCNSVLNPGTVIGRHSSIYPVSCVRGVVPENSIYKSGGNIVKKLG
ncbi:MAG: UDP-N-acetylglucosamine pyrophosphorylase [Oscillospiraceae bacterium]